MWGFDQEPAPAAMSAAIAPVSPPGVVDMVGNPLSVHDTVALRRSRGGKNILSIAVIVGMDGMDAVAQPLWHSAGALSWVKDGPAKRYRSADLVKCPIPQGSKIVL